MTACCAVSATMCTAERRTERVATGGNHGASGSGYAASRSGSVATSSSVRPFGGAAQQRTVCGEHFEQIASFRAEVV